MEQNKYLLIENISEEYLRKLIEKEFVKLSSLLQIKLSPPPTN